MEVDFVEKIQQFIVDNLKIFRAQDPWAYDPHGMFAETLKRNKKPLSFKHELHSQIECYSNQMDKEAEHTLEWELAPLKKDWLEMLRVKKHQS